MAVLKDNFRIIKILHYFALLPIIRLKVRKMEAIKFMRKRTGFFILAFFIFVSSAAFAGYKIYRGYSQLKKKEALLEKRKVAWGKLKAVLDDRITGFDGQLGIVIKDLETNWEIDFNKSALFPSASLVKVPILLSYFYAVQEGKMRLDDTVRLKPSERVEGSKVLGGLPAGYLFSVEKLFDPMITISDNTAANILIDWMGRDTLNAYFGKLGLRNTNLSRKMMAFADRRGGKENYTTAEDMAYILEKLYQRRFINKDVSERCLGFLKQQKINDRIPRELPGTVSVAHKTGLENHICHDVGIVFTEKGDFLICVLAKHQDRFAYHTKKLISDIALLTYNYYQGL